MTIKFVQSITLQVPLHTDSGGTSSSTAEDGQPLLYSLSTSKAEYSALNIQNVDAITGVLPPAFGGTGRNNAANTLDVRGNTIIEDGGVITLGGFTITVLNDLALLGHSGPTSTRIPFASSSTNVLTDDADLAWNNTTKHLFIGGTPASDVAKVSILTSDTLTSTATIGLSLEQVFNSASAMSASKRGLQFAVYLDGSGGGSGDGLGLVGEAQNRQTAGTIASLAAASCNVRVTNAGNVTNGYGYRTAPVLSNAGNLVTWRAFEARSPTRSSTGSITTSTGLYIERQKLAAGVTTGYGIFQADSNDLNHFAGSINTSTRYDVSNTQVVGARVTGWNAPTTGGGALLRGTFDTGATLVTTARTLAALITDLRSHGLINT